MCSCRVLTKRLSRAKQALAKSFSQVSAASAAFQHWRKLAWLSSYASAATIALGSSERLGSVTSSEGSTQEDDITLQTDVKEMAHTLQIESTTVTAASSRDYLQLKAPQQLRMAELST